MDYSHREPNNPVMMTRMLQPSANHNNNPIVDNDPFSSAIQEFHC
jgi:hypothetical protein